MTLNNITTTFYNKRQIILRILMESHYFMWEWLQSPLSPRSQGSVKMKWLIKSARWSPQKIKQSHFQHKKNVKFDHFSKWILSMHKCKSRVGILGDISWGKHLTFEFGFDESILQVVIHPVLAKQFLPWLLKVDLS